MLFPFITCTASAKLSQFKKFKQDRIFDALKYPYAIIFCYEDEDP